MINLKKMKNTKENFLKILLKLEEPAFVLKIN